MKNKIKFYIAMLLIPGSIAAGIYVGSHANFYIGVLTWFILTLIASRLIRKI